MSLLTRDEQRLLRALGGWKLAELLVRPDTFTTEYGGRSHCTVLGDDNHWLDYDSKGIGVGPIGGPQGLYLRWPKARRYAHTLDEDLVEQIKDCLKRRAEEQRAFLPFGVEERKRLTYREWHEQHAQPHYERQRVLDEELSTLLDVALPRAGGLCDCARLSMVHVYETGCAA